MRHSTATCVQRRPVSSFAASLCCACVCAQLVQWSRFAYGLGPGSRGSWFPTRIDSSIRAPPAEHELTVHSANTAQYAAVSSRLVVCAGKAPVLQQPTCDECPARAFFKPCRSGSVAFVSSTAVKGNNDRGVTHFSHVTRRHSRSMASSLLSAEDIDKLQRRFSTLEADIDKLSTVLSQLPAARSSGPGSARRLSNNGRPFGTNQVADGRRGLFGAPSTRTRHAQLLGHLMVVFVAAGVALALWRIRLLEVGK